MKEAIKSPNEQQSKTENRPEKNKNIPRFGFTPNNSGFSRDSVKRRNSVSLEMTECRTKLMRGAGVGSIKKLAVLISSIQI
jgi:hypothetical protein